MELKNFLNEIGENPKVIIFEDNSAVLSVTKNGTGGKHMNGKIQYVKQVISDNNFELRYIDTKQMIADIFTKPLNGTTYTDLREKLFEYKK